MARRAVGRDLAPDLVCQVCPLNHMPPEMIKLPWEWTPLLSRERERSQRTPTKRKTIPSAQTINYVRDPLSLSLSLGLCFSAAIRVHAHCSPCSVTYTWIIKIIDSTHFSVRKTAGVESQVRRMSNRQKSTRGCPACMAVHMRDSLICAHRAWKGCEKQKGTARGGWYVVLLWLQRHLWNVWTLQGFSHV